MSSLSLPRIIFFGTTSWNPNTVNNSSSVYNETTVEPVLGNMTFAQYSQWLFQMSSSGALNGSWNVFGDYAVNFNATVTGVQPDLDPSDPLIGLPVTIGTSSESARMVDVDPYSPLSTQILYQTVSIGNATVGVSGTAACRMFSRWLNLSRNLVNPLPSDMSPAGGMGVIWQAALPKASLDWGNGFEGSPGLAALKTALELNSDNQGLVLLFATYCTLYYQTVTWQGQRVTTAQELGNAYQTGFQGGNPAISTTLGRVGIWGPGELATAPTDILLAPPPAVSTKTAAALPIFSSSRPQGRDSVLKQAATATPLPPIGPALARLDRLLNVVAVDLLATIPESGPTLAKANLGNLVLQVVSADGSSTTTIGQPLTYAQYDQQAYVSNGGVAEFSFADNPGLAEVIASGTLQLVSIPETTPETNSGTSSGTVVLKQVPLVSETDQRGLCVDEGTTATIQVCTYQNGVTPPAETVQLLVVPYDENLDQITDPSQAIFELLDGNGNPLPLSPTLPVGADGTTTLTVSPLQPGICSYFLFPFTGTNPPAVPSSLFPAPNNYFFILRALPFDNALNQNTPDSAITWPFIYQTVLSTWDVVYPLMSTIIPLSNEEDVNKMAPAIITRLSKEDPLQSPLYMPISRDMSAGKKSLLLRYLNALPSGSGGSGSGAPPAPPRPDRGGAS